MNTAYAKTLKRGMSLCYMRGFEDETLLRMAQAGIVCVEISYPHFVYLDEMDFLHRAAEYGERIRRAGLEVASLHTSFLHDISHPEEQGRSSGIRDVEDFITAAREAGAKTAVLHPSEGDIPEGEEERVPYLARSHDAICHLAEFADKQGLVLAVENLPRRCLGRTPEEMVTLVSGTGASVVFDSNHSLKESSASFLEKILRAGLTLCTVHLSDYDGADERHRLPGDGIAEWEKILSLLEGAKYAGPLMYEVPKVTPEREPLTLAAVRRNMDDLVAGRIH